MEGVITRAQVLAHPVLIVESFGARVLIQALLSHGRETFLEVVRRCAEEEEHRGLEELDLERTAERFIRFECQARDIYRTLSRRLTAVPEAAAFFARIAGHEEGHATVLSRVRREVRRGHLWTPSRLELLESLEAFSARLAHLEAESFREIDLARALEIVEEIEGSEINHVFECLNKSVDMSSRARFEKLFVMTEAHLRYCEAQVKALRERHGIAGGWGVAPFCAVAS